MSDGLMRVNMDEAASGCCHRLLAELHHPLPLFGVRDVITAAGRQIDIERSFAPTGCRVVVWKGLAVSTAFFTLWYCWMDVPGNFYMAYLSAWGVAYACLYLLLSLCNTLLAKYKQQTTTTTTTETNTDTAAVSLPIRCAWVLAEVATHWETSVSLQNWVLCYPYSVKDFLDYRAISQHGLLTILVWIDVFYVNRVPFRLSHWGAFVLPLQSLWILWSLLFAYVDAWYKPDDIGDDDMIYSFWDWHVGWRTTLILSLLDLFVMSPAVFVCLWWLSIYKLPCCGCGAGADRRRYLDDNNYCTHENHNFNPSNGGTSKDAEDVYVLATYGSTA